MHRAPMMGSASGFQRSRQGDFDRFRHFNRFNDGDFDRDDRFRRFHRFNEVVVFDNFGFPFFPFFYPYPYYYPYGYYPYGYYGNGYYGGAGYGGYGYGDRSRVAEMQRRLAQAGYYHGSIDCIMGPRTRRAMRAYQRDHGTGAYGMLDRQLFRPVSTG